MNKGKKKFKNTQKDLLNAEMYLYSQGVEINKGKTSDATVLFLANNHYNKHEAEE